MTPLLLNAQVSDRRHQEDLRVTEGLEEEKPVSCVIYVFSCEGLGTATVSSPERRPCTHSQSIPIRRDQYEPDVQLYWVEDPMKGRLLTFGCKMLHHACMRVLICATPSMSS